MAQALTTDQYRILRNARDGIVAPACVVRPKGYFLDVEALVRDSLVKAHDGALELTPKGAGYLAPGRPG